MAVDVAATVAAGTVTDTAADTASAVVRAETPSATRRGLIVRMTATFFVVTLVGAYSVGVISGIIADGRKIDATHFALIMVAVIIAAVLVQPDLLSRLKVLKLAGVEVEMLEQVKQKQSVQESQLADIRLMLPLLFPEAERKHLFNLARHATSNYEGNHSLRSELRRLRSADLVRMRDGRHVGDIKDGHLVDLEDYVELTPLAERWVRRIREIEEAEEQPDGQPKS